MRARKWILVFSITATCTVAMIDCVAQVDESPVTKIGGWYYFNSPSYNTLSVERERSIRQSLTFTHGPRLDLNFGETSGLLSMAMGYQFKYYPFSLLREKPSRGVFLGLEPCYFIKVREQTVYGPGIGTLLGYQLWIKNKVAVSLETSLKYMQNMNPNALGVYLNSWYLHSFLFLKVGMRIDRKK